MSTALPMPRAMAWLVWAAFFVMLSGLLPSVSAAEDTEVVKLVGTLHGIGGKLVYFSPDGSKLLTVGKDAARVWDLRTMKPVADAAIKHDGDIEDAGWLADGQRVFTAGGKEVRVWDPMTPKVVASIRQDVPVKTGCVSPDGKLIVAGSEPGVGVVWNATTGKPLYELKGPGELLKARFSGDGKILATLTFKKSAVVKRYFEGNGTADVRILNSESGVELTQSNTIRFKKLDQVAPFAQFSPDGKKLAVSHFIGFTVLDVETGQRLWARDGTVVQFTADSTKLMSAGSHAVIWNVKTGNETSKYAIHRTWSSYPQGAATNPDGSLVFIADWNDEASVWDMRTGQELQEFGQPGTEAVAVSPDGHLVALSYSQEPTEIWEIIRK